MKIIFKTKDGAEIRTVSFHEEFVQPDGQTESTDEVVELTDENLEYILKRMIERELKQPLEVIRE